MPPGSAPPRRSLAMAVPGLLLAGAVIGIALWAGLIGGWFQTENASPALRLSIAIPDDPGSRKSEDHLPDGQTIVYVGAEKVGRDGEPATTRLYTRRLEEDEAQPIQGSEGIRQFDLSHRMACASRSWLLPLASQRDSRSGRCRWTARLHPWPSGIIPTTWSGLLWVPGEQIVAMSETPAALIRIPVDGSKPGEPLLLEMSNLNVNQGPVAYLPNGKPALQHLHLG